MAEAKVAVITGSNKGIGRTIAERLAHAGYAVGINFHRDAASAQDTLGALREISPASRAIQADVATPDGFRPCLSAEAETLHALGHRKRLPVDGQLYLGPVIAQGKPWICAYSEAPEVVRNGGLGKTQGPCDVDL